MPDQAQKNNFLKWLLLVVAIFFIAGIGSAGAYWTFLNNHKDRFFTGVSLGRINLSLMTKPQAVQLVQQVLDQVRQSGIVFTYHNQSTTLYPVISSVEGDLAFEVVSFDPEASIARAYAYGRSGNFWVRLGQQYEALVNRHSEPLGFTLNQVPFDKFLEDNFAHFQNPAQDAALSVTKDGKDFTYTVTEEKYGQKLDFVGAKEAFKQRLAMLDTSPVAINATIDYPRIIKADCLNIADQANDIMAKAPLTLVFADRSWTLDQDELAAYLVLERSDNENTIGVGLDQTKLENYLRQVIAPAIDQEPVDPKFAVENGKVVEFRLSQEGELTDVASTVAAVYNQFLSGATSTVAVVTEKVKSDLNASEVNNMGVKELLGTGHSNFSGSPANRRHNIATGAEAVNGTLIAPGEEFSLLKVLGEINKESGYLPELVIKENKTVPEYGGGLCQIGTTAFRGTLAAGLPVTMRRNHSYRVSYYEPAGTDATIYDPWPDYRFRNDYQSHILITTRIDGDDLYFDFWGTRDGRTATTTYPVIYNIAKPAETKYIETLDLAPGQKKCTEHAHNGADAYFDYTVTYSGYVPEGFADREGVDPATNTEQTRFKSHYVPWREVCLVGVEKLTEDKENIDPDKVENMVSSTSLESTN